ncbi:MAG: class I SAM-dependent methyltransferase [Candidatus Woesearchaeota archaeon]
MDIDIKIKELDKMDYSSFVGLIKERNRPSGGIKTVQEVAINTFLNENKKILEIGSNTGFTTINLCLLTGCSGHGIDINDSSIEESNRLANVHGIQDKVKFSKADATNLPFEDESFDIVWCSNVTSFIGDKQKAISEYLRVLKQNGTLVFVPIYYLEEPPKELIREVSEAIASKIEVYSKQHWLNLIRKVLNETTNFDLELYFNKDYRYLNVETEILDYISKVLDKPHLKEKNIEYRDAVFKRAKYFMNLFNENLKYAGYSIFLFQKRREAEEVELFKTIEVFTKDEIK